MVEVRDLNDRLPQGVVTAMFTDIVKSTSLKTAMEGATEAERDANYRSNIQTPHEEIVLGCVRAAHGHKVNSAGDGFLCTFSSAEEGVLCALRILEELSANPIETPNGRLQVRIGLHTGHAHPSGSDYTSAVMDRAARIQGQAPAGQVYVSNETKVLAQRVRGVIFETAGTFELKGLGREELYRVLPAQAVDQRPATSTGNRDAQLIEQLQNPYEFATTANSKTFKGRDSEIDELLDSIQTGTHTAVFGLQRMGKTSLIDEGLRRKLEGQPDLSTSLLLIKIDMQRLGGAQVTYRDFVHGIVEAVAEKVAGLGLGRSVPNLRSLTRELFSPGQYQRGDRTEFFSVFAKLINDLSTATKRRIVLFVDEFSEIRKVIERNKTLLQNNPVRTTKLLPHDMYLDVPFIHHLGSLLKDQLLKKQFTLIALVRPFISEYDEREELQLFKLMKPITLYRLDKEAATALITEPLAGVVNYEEGAVHYLYDHTAGHPYLLQFMLKLIIDKIKREKRLQVTLDDIQGVEHRMISEGPAYDAQFEVLISDYSVDEVTHPKESRLGKGLLALVAHRSEQAEDQWVSSEQIFTNMETQKIPTDKTASLLSQLTRTKILDEKTLDDQLRYRIAIPLLQERFVRQNLYRKYFR